MPTYDYVCDACEHTFELFQQMTAPVKKKCPACGKLKLKRLIGTGAGVIFKGSGFYQTDYRTDSYKKGADQEKKSKEDTSAKKDSKKDDKKASSEKKTTPGKDTPRKDAPGKDTPGKDKQKK